MNHAELTSRISPSISRRQAVGIALSGALAGSVALSTTNPAHAATTFSLSGGNVTATAGSVRDANQRWRSSYKLLTGDTTASWDALPFHQFEVPAENTPSVDIYWEGTSNPGARVRLLVWNTSLGSFEELASTVADSKGAVKFYRSVPTGSHVVEGKVKVLVQHSVGYSGGNLSSKTSSFIPEHPADTPRAQYDFTLAWESDTQYYNESFPDRQLDIHNYLLRQRVPMNIQYVFHTGDIVDEYDKPVQWERANTAYAMFDQAKFPYGVLGGNHDVGQYDEKGFPVYSQHFGEARFARNPWYGGNHKNNRGHFDLISAGGHDFIFVHMSWAPKDAEFAWMNRVLASFPERTAILATHEYLNLDGSMSPTATRIKDEVVAKNPNVRMVLSGHVHGAMKNQHFFDDNGDGVAERTVTNILFDAQGLPEGGQAFTRLMHFDNQSQRVLSRSYSPYLKKHTTDHSAFPKPYQEFVLSYAELGLKMKKKTLKTTHFSARFA